MSTSKEHDTGTRNGQAEHAESSRASMSIGDEVDLFIKQIDSLMETLPFTLVAIKVGYDKTTKSTKSSLRSIVR